MRSPTYSVSYGLRGFMVDGKTDQAVALMKQIKVYPLEQAKNPPKMEFLNGSGQPNRHHPFGHDHVLRTARRTGERGARGGFHAARAVLYAGHRHREGQTLCARRQREGIAVGTRPWPPRQWRVPTALRPTTR